MAIEKLRLGWFSYHFHWIRCLLYTQQKTNCCWLTCTG